MTSYRPSIATVPPPTLEKQLEVLAAAHGLAAQEDEAVRWRREEIAAVRRELGELARLNQVLQRQWGELVAWDQEQRRRRDPRLRSHVIRGDAEPSLALKASPDDSKHPGWPAGTPDGKGGKFRPKDDEPGAAQGPPVKYAAAGDFPPAPPGYDPQTWKQGRWSDNNKYFLKDPDGNVYTVHPEDEDHWRHWDKRGGDNNDQGRWPPNSIKAREGQKRLRGDQSASDPSGDAPPWAPKPDPFVPATPFPDQLPTIRAPAPTPAIRAPVPIEIIIPRIPLVIPP